ncbi:ABC transporter permease [Bacillus carboniphilus]|uniref:ABC transporter permease n=1 Tax=Bacillus carboniphilus TaxID=86663 RepID=A0ABY9JV49_9BACI|nr:ABC transporter permease [Bacillus carboniphilus]WLR43281.1 ABC transporter permease [Bacillus carboniphilus]
MKIVALISRIIRQFVRDPRTLALMLIAPIFILTLINLVFTSGETTYEIGYEDADETSVENLDHDNFTFSSYDKTKPKEAIIEHNLDAFISLDDKEIIITLEGSDPTTSKAIISLIASSVNNGGQANAEPTINYIYGSADMDLFDSIGPVLIGFFIFFFVFLIAGVSFLRERTTGTLERLLSTPIHRYELVFGYIFGFGIFTLFQTTIITWYSIYILDVMHEGSFLYVLFISLLLSLTALTLGTLLSTFANNELQMMQFIPIIVIPQVFFSGLFPLDSMADWLASLSVIMPLTYGASALEEVMIKGNGFEAFSTEVYVLVGFTVLFACLNIFALKRYRKI